jgi:hypothetical protein
VASAVENGRLLWLAFEGGTFRREDGAVVPAGTLDPGVRFALSGTHTLVEREGRLRVFAGGSGSSSGLAPPASPEVLVVEGPPGSQPFAATSRHRYWLAAGDLVRDGRFAPTCIGRVVRGMARFWVGEVFGLGFYRLGEGTVGFVFSENESSLKDTVALPPVRGRLLHADCRFGGEQAWLLTATEIGGKITHRVTVANARGEVLATDTAESGDGTWLGGPLETTVCAGRGLLALGPQGLVRVDVVSGGTARGTLSVAREFPDSQRFVQPGQRLHAAQAGLYVVAAHEIRLLEIR